MRDWLPSKKQWVHYFILIVILYCASRYFFDKENEVEDDIVKDQVVTVVDDAFEESVK